MTANFRSRGKFRQMEIGLKVYLDRDYFNVIHMHMFNLFIWNIFSHKRHIIPTPLTSFISRLIRLDKPSTMLG